MIIDGDRPHKYRHERPPRDSGDTAPLQCPPHEPALSLGSYDRTNLSTGIFERSREMSPMPTAEDYRRINKHSAEKRRLKAAFDRAYLEVINNA